MGTSLNVVNKSAVADLQRSVPELRWFKVKVVKQVKGADNSSPSIMYFQTIKESLCKGYAEFIQERVIFES